MKRITVVLAIFTLLFIAVAPSYAKERPPRDQNPSEQCAENKILISFMGETFPLEIMNHGGCVSTVASIGSPVAPGDYSHAAFVAQCKFLKGVLPQDLWEEPVNFETIEGVPIPVNTGGFGGKIQTCTYLLKGYHSGEFIHD